LVNEEYPEIEQFFEFEGDEFKLPNALKEQIETAAVMSDGSFDVDQNISVVISKDGIIVRGEKDVGWVEGKVKADFDIDSDVKFMINPGFFRTILDKTNIVKIGDNCAMFSIGDNFRHLVALPANE